MLADPDTDTPAADVESDSRVWFGMGLFGSVTYVFVDIICATLSSVSVDTNILMYFISVSSMRRIAYRSFRDAPPIMLKVYVLISKKYAVTKHPIRIAIVMNIMTYLIICTESVDVDVDMSVAVAVAVAIELALEISMLIHRI